MGLFQNTKIILEYLKDIFTILSLLIASGVALAGLFIWKRQLHGTQSYELAKKILKSVFSIRDYLKQARYPITDMEEDLASQIIETKYKDELEIFYEGCIFREVLGMRWKKIEEELRVLEIETFEAEAIWGKEKCLSIYAISNLAKAFNGNVDAYIHLIFSGISHEIIHKDFKPILDIIFCNPAHPNDNFEEEINSAVIAISKDVRPYLIK